MRRTAWIVVFTEPGFKTKPELEVFWTRDNARRAAADELDPGWHSQVYRVYLDEKHESYSEPRLSVEDE